MSPHGLTPDEYDLHLKDLRERLSDFLETGGGNPKQLLKEAEDVLVLREEFPEVFRRYPDIEGLVAELLARQEQAKFFAPQLAPQSGSPQSPGCLLGWLFTKNRD